MTIIRIMRKNLRAGPINDLRWAPGLRDKLHPELSAADFHTLKLSVPDFINQEPDHSK